MKIRFALAVAVVLGLSGCASDTAIDSTLDASLNLVREQIAARNAPAPAAQLTTEQRVALGLRLIPSGPLVLATTVEGDTGESVLFLAARNGDVTALTSVGGQTLALRDGMLLNTRGLKYDLLSSDSRESTRLIAARSAGRATRMHEMSTVDLAGDRQVYGCEIAPAGPRRIDLPTGRAQDTILMIENCRNARENFVNQYWVGPDGYIWQSRQWTGETYGHIDFATIRR